jgi:hypothetical protein
MVVQVYDTLSSIGVEPVEVSRRVASVLRRKFGSNGKILGMLFPD